MECEKEIELKQQLLKDKTNINAKIDDLNQKLQIRITILSGLLKGIILDKENAPSKESQKILLQGGENMKFRNVSIIKNTNCNTWTARPTINGKQIYKSAKTQQECYNNNF